MGRLVRLGRRRAAAPPLPLNISRRDAESSGAQTVEGQRELLPRRAAAPQIGAPRFAEPRAIAAVHRPWAVVHPMEPIDRPNGIVDRPAGMSQSARVILLGSGRGSNATSVEQPRRN